MMVRPITLWCDGIDGTGNCTHELETGETKTERALVKAKAAGWTHSHRSNEDRCPQHTDEAMRKRVSEHGARV